MTKTTPRRWIPGEHPLLDAVDQAVSDWTAVTWEIRLHNIIGKSYTEARYLLGPGAVAIRKIYSPYPESVEVTSTVDPGDYETMTEFATEGPKELSGIFPIELTVRPFVVDLTQNNFHQSLMDKPKDLFSGHSITTLGDVIEHGSNDMMDLLFNRVAFLREQG